MSRDERKPFIWFGIVVLILFVLGAYGYFTGAWQPLPDPPV
jgi:hypothetical protein